MDLSYTNRAGISLNDIMDILVENKGVSKKHIQEVLKTTKSIDVLLKKLESASLIKKDKKGNKLVYSKEKSSKIKKVNKAKSVRSKTPAKVKEINRQTSVISKDHKITALVEIDDTKPIRGQRTEAVNSSDLDVLKKEMESKLGKEVTAVLHKRNDKAIKKRKETAQKIYEKQQTQIVSDGKVYETDNPYKFILNFFISTLNGEKATPYFRRRDEYVVNSIYNKFKTLCTVEDEYSVPAQNLPFYRVITINVNEGNVKMYHIDMNRVVRGVYTIFKLNQNDDSFIKFKESSTNG